MNTLTQTKRILETHLQNNDINIVGIILGYITDKCDGCKDVVFTTELDEIHIPNCYTTDCGEHQQDEDCGWINTYYCPTCVEENCCKECVDLCCEKCDNKYVCDEENCDNIFCEDCSGDVMIWCNNCEERFCCRKFYKFIGTDLEYNYHCEKCILIGMEVVKGKYCK